MIAIWSICPRYINPRGNLTFVEGRQHIPFDIQRVYYLYDVPGGAERGGHAHKALHQLIIAMSGSFDVVLDDGGQKTFSPQSLILRPVCLPDDLARTRQFLVRLGLHGARLQSLRRSGLLP